jgi:phage terminase large subunit GpA-like protein
MICSLKGIRQSAAIIRPRTRLKISEWAGRDAYLGSDSAEPGRYRLSRMPHQVEMLDDPQEAGIREIFWMMASQAAGKTLCLILICEFVISQLHRSLIMVRDTKDRALEWMRDKFEPICDATPCMRGMLVEPRKRGSNSTSLSRRFPGGVFKLIGAKSRGAFRSTSAGVVLQDEVDAYETVKEGDPCALADRATITFTDAWKIKASTPTLEGFSRIESGFKRGDQRLYFVPCLHCGEFQVLDFEQLKFTFTKEEHIRFENSKFQAPSSNLEEVVNGHAWEIGSFPIRDTRRAIYVCEHCHRGWTDDQRIGAYLSGHVDNPAVMVNGKELRAHWRATAPLNGIRSRHLSGMYLTIGLEKGFDNYLHQFAENFLTAKHGGRETLMAWTNMFRALPYADPAEKVDWKDLEKRAEQYLPELPAEVCWIAFGADLQQDRIEFLFYGWGDAQEVWALEHHVIYGDFDMPGCQQRVEDYIFNKRFTHPILGEMAWSAGVFDSGKQTKVQAVYAFCAKHRLANVFSCKGFDQALGAVFQRATERRFGGTRFNFNVDYLKSMVFDRLRNKEPGPRYVHFPKLFEPKFYTGLCSERRMPVKQPKGGTVWRWIKHASSTRNEILDMTVYAFGIFEVCRQEEWIARKWKEIQKKLRERNPPAAVEKREYVLNPPAEEKLPELKRDEPAKPAMRRRIRIASPFGRFR